MKSATEKRGSGTGQRTQPQAWYVNYVRSHEECRKFQIPLTIPTTCGKCRNALQQGATMMDSDARWTINTPPTYLLRQGTCGAPGHEKATFVPVNADIPTVSEGGLIAFWYKNDLPWQVIATRFARSMPS